MRHNSGLEFARSAGPRLVSGGLTVLVLAAACLLYQPGLAQEHDEHSLGLIASDNASAKDVGLPIYPRSKPHREKSDDSPAARLGLWGAGAGFKLSIVKMETGDSAEKVAAFYKKALSKYGKVLDCSDASSARPDAADSSDALTCGDDKPEKGGMLFKAGTKEKQHLVSILPNQQGASYQLVALEDWGNDHKH